MITDIPDKQDFLQNGLSMLNLSWDAVARLLIDPDYADLDAEGEEELTKKAYWKAAQEERSGSALDTGHMRKSDLNALEILKYGNTEGTFLKYNEYKF